MKKIRVGDLKDGMIVAADVFEAGSTIGIPFVRKGVILNPDYISRLKNRGIGFVLIETPQGYRGAPGEVLTLESAEGDVLFDGKVQVDGSVAANVKIEAGERIVIEGDVAEGCILISAKGGILIKGSINGTKEDPVKIAAVQNVQVHNPSGSNVRFAEIKAEGNINVHGVVTDSSISAKGEINIDGSAVRSQLYTQSRLKVRDCGDANMEPSLLIAKPLECRELSQEMLRTDGKMLELLKEKEKLQNVIDLIKKLGKDIEQLPQAKKIELATGVKRFKGLETEVETMQAKKLSIKNELEKHLGVKRIMVIGNVFPRTKITIENSSVEIAVKTLGVAFHIKDFKVVQSPYTGGF